MIPPHLTDPDAIRDLSFQRLLAACDVSRFPATLAPVVRRIVHACAMPDILTDIAWRGDVSAAAATALNARKPVLCDCRMTASGLTHLPADSPVLCLLNDDTPPPGRTRSAAAVDLWTPHMDGAIILIGNAPTALFRLLERLNESATPHPALILAFPVGFVGAAESKQALADSPLPIPFLTLLGQRGGSPMAAAALNALAAETLP